jgi:hypothetical protein
MQRYFYFALTHLENTRMRGAARKKIKGLRKKEGVGDRGWGGRMGRRGWGVGDRRAIIPC